MILYVVCSFSDSGKEVKGKIGQVSLNELFLSNRQERWTDVCDKGSTVPVNPGANDVNCNFLLHAKTLQRFIKCD